MVSKRSGRSCKKRTPWGRCQQTAGELGLCSAHQRWAQTSEIPDPYYEQKVVEGLIVPTWDWMTDSEASTLLNGRYRGDGRRLDQWIAGDPLMVEL